MLLARTFFPLSLSAADGAQMAQAELVSGNYFDVLRVKPFAGRFFDTTGDRPGGELQGVLSHALWRRRFGADPSGIGRSMRVNGQPMVVVGIAPPGFVGAMQLIAADPWLPAAIAPGGARQLVWFERSGRELSRIGTPEPMLNQPSLSHDASGVVFYRNFDGNVDIWMVETGRGALRRITSHPADDVFPVWAPDDTRIAFSSNRGTAGVHDLYQKSTAGSGADELLLSTPLFKTPTDWSSDGEYLLFNNADSDGNMDVWALSLTGDRKAFPVADMKDFEEQAAQFSPDGNWIAYQSNESGTSQIYVQAFPGPGERLPVSTAGGMQVRWRRGGKELFYIARDGMLMVVPISLRGKTQRPDIGAPTALFAPSLGGAVRPGDPRHQYMPSADGQRLLVATVTSASHAPVSLIVNWKPAH